MNEIIKRINDAQHIVVIAHMNPDADSLGSASAMYTYLLTLHKKVSFFCVSKIIHQKLSFLPWFDKIRTSFPSSADLAISFDCGSKERIGIELPCDLINIDHHKSNSRFGTYNIVDFNCISTTEVLYDFFKINNININKKMATSLYAGLLDDSNGFLSDDIDGTTFAMSRELIECDADYKICNTFIMKYQTLAGLRLKAIMLKNMKLLSNGRIALHLVSKEDLSTTGALAQDCENALEESLCLPTVNVAVLLRENKDLTLKVSLRIDGKLDASKIASKYNGGGHQARAGCIMNSEYTLQSASEEILELINKEIKFGKK